MGLYLEAACKLAWWIVQQERNANSWPSTVGVSAA
jgi:hypothetical protein